MVVFVGGIWFKIQRKLFGYLVSISPRWDSYLLTKCKTFTEALPIAARHGESSAERLEVIRVRTGENEGYEVLCETFGTIPDPNTGDDDEDY